MAYGTLEASAENGRPIRNFEFARGPLRWMYTTADRDITFNNKTFKSGMQVGDDGIQFTGQAVADTVNVNIAADSEIALAYRGIAPSDRVTLTIWEHHYQDNEWIVNWLGVVTGVTWPTDYTARVSAQSMVSALEAPGLRMGWQRACPHTLYGPDCRANKSSYRTDGVILTKTGTQIVVAAASGFPINWFAGGVVEWDVGNSVTERRGIQSHWGSGLNILGSTFGMEPNQVVRLFPGCMRTTAVCSSKFNNLDNYGGCPHLPGRSPFDGNPVW